MTTGILTNKETDDTLHVTVKRYDYSLMAVYKITGTSDGGYIAVNKDWTFTEDKPNIGEQLKALSIGATFVTDYDTNGEWGYWIKVSDNNVVYVDWDEDIDYKAWEYQSSHYTELIPFTVKNS